MQTERDGVSIAEEEKFSSGQVLSTYYNKNYRNWFRYSLGESPHVFKVLIEASIIFKSG